MSSAGTRIGHIVLGLIMEAVPNVIGRLPAMFFRVLLNQPRQNGLMQHGQLQAQAGGPWALACPPLRTVRTERMERPERIACPDERTSLGRNN